MTSNLSAENLKDEVTHRNYAWPLELRHRDAMLDLVLAWGTLDGALTMLVGDINGWPLPETAKEFHKKKASIKFRCAIKSLEKNKGLTGSAEEAVKKLKKIKKDYEKYSKIRNIIVHSKCIGYLKKYEERIVFLIAEPEDENEMRIEAIHITYIKQAICYAEQIIQICTASEL